LNGQALFNPYHVGDCLEISPEGVRKAITRMNKKQAIKLKNSDVTISNIRKLNNAGGIFADITTRFCTAQIKGQLNFELSGLSSPP